MKFERVDETGFYTRGWVNKQKFQSKFLCTELNRIEYGFSSDRPPVPKYGYATIQQIQGGERARDHAYKHWCSLNPDITSAEAAIEHSKSAHIIPVTYVAHA